MEDFLGAGDSVDRSADSAPTLGDEEKVRCERSFLGRCVGFSARRIGRSGDAEEVKVRLVSLGRRRRAYLCKHRPGSMLGTGVGNGRLRRPSRLSEQDVVEVVVCDRCCCP